MSRREDEPKAPPKCPELGGPQLPLDARFIYDPRACGNMNAAVILDAATWREWFGERQ